MLVSVISVGKSLGSTSVALGLANAWADRGADPTLVELDPSGGDLAAWWGFDTVDPGVRSLVANLATTEDSVLSAASEVLRHSQAGPNDQRVLCMPAAAEGDGLNRLASDLGSRWGMALQAPTGPVIADAGRYGASTVAADRLSTASVVVALVSPDVAGVDRARHIFPALLREIHPPKVMAVLVGERPYGIEEVQAELRGVEVVASLPRDGSAAFGAVHHAGSKKQRRRPWQRILGGLTELIDEETSWSPEGVSADG